MMYNYYIFAMKKTILLIIIICCQVTLAQTNRYANPAKSANNSVLGSTPSIIFPNGGEKLFAGTDTTISWTGFTDSTVVDISYSTDNGDSWSIIGKSLKGNTYRWQPVANQNSDKCLMRVQKDRTLFSYPVIKGLPLVMWSPNGKYIALTDESRYVRVLDSQTLSTIYTFNGVYSCNVAFSPDGNLVAAGDLCGNIIIIDLTKGEKTDYITKIGCGGVSTRSYTISWSPDGTYIAYSNYSTIRILNLKNGKTSKIQGISEYNPAICWSMDSKRITFLTNNNSRFEIWDVEKNQLIKAITDKSDMRMKCIACSPDGKTVATGTSENKIRIWDVQKGELITTLLDYKWGDQKLVKYCPDGKYLMAADQACSVKIWNSDGYSLICTLVKSDQEYNTIDWAPDSKSIICMDDEMNITHIECPSGKVIKKYAALKGPVKSISWSPDSKSIIAATIYPEVSSTDHYTKYLKRWNADNMEFDTLLYKFKDDNTTFEASCSPDSKYIGMVSGSSVNIYELNGMNFLFQMNESFSKNFFPQWSPDSTKIACGAIDAGVVIHDLKTKAFLRLISSKLIKSDNMYCWSHDGKYIIIGTTHKTIQFWDVNSGNLQREMPIPLSKAGLNYKLNMSPDGKKIAYSDGDSIYIIKVEDGSVLFTKPGKEVPLWSHDSKILFYSGSYFMDSDSGKIISNIYKNSNCVDASWNPKDNRIAIASASDITIVDAGDLTENGMSMANWSIVKPKAGCSSDVNMGRIAVDSYKDSIISNYISNTGQYPIRIDSIVISEYYDRAFRVANGTTPFYLEPGESKSVEFLFRPQSIGTHTAQIFVCTQADTVKQTITGEGVLSALFVRNNFIDFGIVNTGSVNDTLITSIINNPGSVAININSIKIRDDKDGEFSILTGTNPFVLNGGDSVGVGLSFKPLSAGYKSCRLEYSHSGEGSIVTIYLYGTASTTNSVEEHRPQQKWGNGILTIKPNPAGDVLNIELLPDVPGEYSISIIDLLGNSVKLLYSGFLTDETKSISSDISSLAAGLYYVIVRSSVSEQVKTFVKE